MNHHETGTHRTSRMTTSSATPTPTKLQRARVFASTYWRCFARSSSASCCARSAASGMQEKMARADGEWKRGGGLHPEQVAELQEEPVRRAAQVRNLERVDLRERRPVPKEAHVPGDGLEENRTA